jgi:protein TonB
MKPLDRSWNRDRTISAIGVAGFHALIGYGLIVGLGVEFPKEIRDNFKVFDVPREPPPPPPVPEPPPPKTRAKEPEGAASPPNIKSKPTPVVAPPPKVQLKVPPKIVTAEKALPVPPGNDPTAGSSNVVGPGTGSGGTGTGIGSGGSGTGTGGGGDGDGGGLASKAQRIRGGLSYLALPRAARERRARGSVAVLYTVTASGSVTGCSVVRSSGDSDLDRATCPQIESRFRYRPARDPAGRPTSDRVSTVFTWIPTG